ncbi:fumarylacetoacetate hydrolase family protein [Micromonospora sp. Llam7]|uniref:fumarylacetoacetate hydrolase family protein n=1 Tax=Micromonospora tarapacensis TaxID=2835305 RepID=UPI001C831DC8|nr:fumarylacetoacetate hydrolase family protein [Micromonospora tarapacensis]MBX7266588.1 fumarylacetoacetate hydrolase family protein [Micromonospora tarapacensis]
MNFLRLGPAGREIPAVQREGTTYDLRTLTADLDGAFWSSDGIAGTRAALDRGDLAELPGAATLRVGAPVARPNKIVCIGLNYRDHAAETGAPHPAEPVVFMKDPMTVVGPFDDVLVPRGSSRTDWEVELAVVVGSTIRYADSPEEAMRCVAGYAVSHDVSERAFQLERGGQWDKGKSCETFNPLGPVLAPADEVGDPQSLSLRLWVNGAIRQDGFTGEMIFPVSHILWYLSQFMVLYPGDVINTGTPAGVALGRPDQPYLRPGDVVELEITGLGRARQAVAAA